MELQQATRKRAKIRALLQGSSGSGKTYSSLLLAYGLCNDYSKIAIIDSENHSADLYSHLGSYNTLGIEAPFTPEKYIEAIKLCEKSGIEVLIIDSLSHEWDGAGGILDIHGSMPGNSFTNWNKVGKIHDAFVQAILQSPCHIIATVRSKQDYVLTDKGGKQVPEKVGLKAIQRDGVDYEFTLVFELDIKQHATATKDRTSLFIDKPAVKLSMKEGKILSEWCNQGYDSFEESKQFSEKIKSINSVPELRTLYLNNPKHKNSHNDEFIAQKEQIEIGRAKEMYNNLNTQKNGTNLNII
ncbi:MAG: AAA family ATPase [Lutibacter sp.]|nr:AAA family ATPase [Lutibacter sp.]